MNGATCVEDPNSFSCTCAEGWTGNTCADAVKQCDRNPCGRGATCQEAPGGFRCLCPLGWTGRTCQLDANECEMGTCVHARSCHNLIGSYLCDCLPGWTGPNCDIRNSSCQGLCLNGGHCEDQLSGSRCVCPTGFTGKHCQNGLDPCDSNPCLHGGQCVMKDGKSATCDCPVGYSGLFCEIENDPCNPNPCQQGVQCQSSEGRPVCTCPDGYYGNECVSLRKPCIGQDCQGAMSDTAHNGLSIYMILLGILALVTICCCIVCTVVLSRLHRKRTKQQSVPQEESINNQREFVNLIRNVERSPGPNLSPASTQPHPPAPVSRCYEEIELTIPPSPAPSHPSPALKPAHAPKMDISNREREKLNRFHCTDNQELEV